MDYINDIAKKIILSKLRLKCSYCYSDFSSDAYIDFSDGKYTDKSFFGFNKKLNKSNLNKKFDLIISNRGCFTNNCESVFYAYKTRCSIKKPYLAGKVVEIELYCKKCYCSRYYEINLEKLSGKNHWA